MLDGFDKLELNGAELTILDGPTVSLFGDAVGLSSSAADRGASAALGAARPRPRPCCATGRRRWARGRGTGSRKTSPAAWRRKGRWTLALTIPRDDPRNAVVDHAEGSFRASGMTVTYLDGLPPLQGVAGEGRLLGNTVTMTLGAAHIGKLVVVGGTVEVTDLDRDPQTVTIDGTVKGPVREALELIDRDRLGYPRKMGIDPKTASGSAEARLHFRLPAKKNVKIEEVDLRIDAAAGRCDPVGCGVRGGCHRRRSRSHGRTQRFDDDRHGADRR